MHSLSAVKYILKINLLNINRNFTVSAAVCGRKSRDPYDRRFGVHPKDVGPNKPGGTRELQLKISREGGCAIPAT